MPFNGSGVYAAPSSSWNPAVAATTIDATDWAALLADIAAALTLCITKDGQQTTTGTIPFATAVTMASTLAVTGATTLTGAVTMAGALSVAGAFDINSSQFHIASNGDTTIVGSFLSTASATRVQAIWNQDTTGSNVFETFITEGGGGMQRGSITYNRGGGVVAYNTTSDYRAKNVLGLVPADDILSSLKPIMGQMKGADLARPMLIAHEAQIVAPWAVTGEKDAVDKDGNPVYQQVSESAFVPLLIAGYQQLRADFDAYKAAHP